MKTTILLSLVLGLFAAAPLCAEKPLAPGPASDAASATRPFAPGLVVTEYPRHASQANDKENFYVPLEQLGEPVGEKYVVESLDPWKWNGERNAVASGFLEIEADGDYSFATRSFYDRNLLMVQGEVVCGFRDGEETVATIPLKKGGRVNILSAGFVGGRGSEGIFIRWKPPGQTELSPIPARLLSHVNDGSAKPKPAEKKLRPSKDLLAAHVITVTDDFVVEAYKNGVRIQDGQRTLLNEIFGATVERMNVQVRPGDWLVFHVVNNHLRWGGSKYFAVAGMLGTNDFGFVSDPASEAWSVCDDPDHVRDFIRRREEGTDIRASAIAKPWEEGDDHMRQNAGAGFPGKSLWGGGASTWIKFVAPKNPPQARQSACRGNGTGQRDYRTGVRSREARARGHAFPHSQAGADLVRHVWQRRQECGCHAASEGVHRTEKGMVCRDSDLPRHRPHSLLEQKPVDRLCEGRRAARGEAL